MTINDKIKLILKSGKLEKEVEDHSLRMKALKRAKNFTSLNAGTPFDWEDMEKMLEQEKKSKE